MLSLLDFLKHIKDETAFILIHSQQLAENDFYENEVLQKAFVRSLEIIGEATKKLPPEFRENYPQINWKAIAGTRDMLIHNYFGVDYQIVWDIIQHEIPELDAELMRIIRIERDRS